MSELSPIKNLKNLKSDMANMSYQEKLLHLWTYYKWVFVVVLILIMCVSVFLAVLENKRTTMLLGGITVNVQLSEEGKSYLSDDYLPIIGTGNKHEIVALSHTDITDVSSTTVYENNYYSVMSLLALCANQEVDYLILDQTGFEAMLIQAAYLGLDEVYTPEELVEFGEDLVYAQNKGETEPSAIALDITDSAFVQENAKVKDKVYFVYVANSPRVEECRAFFEYLMAYK